MAELIVEVLTQSGAHVAYHKVNSLPVSIGRALDNDIILPDPCVSPQHLTIEQGSDGWIAIDHETANGTLLCKDHKLQGPTAINSGTQLLIGETIIMLFSPTHAVPETQHIAPAQPRKEHPGILLLSVVSVFIAGIVVMFNHFLNIAEEIKLVTLLTNLLPALILPFLWAGIWASAGFIVRRRALFGRQLIIANTALILIFGIKVLHEYLDYFTSSVKLANIFQYFCMAGLLSMVLFYSLKIATGNAAVRRVLLPFIIGTGIVAVIAVVEYAKSYEKNITPEYSRTLKPPWAPHVKSVGLDSFIKDSEVLFKKSEAWKDRK